MTKPYSQPCENNKHAILEVISKYFENATRILEIGSGTGQHAVHFAQHMPHLYWQSSDQLKYHPGINLWIDECNLSNIGRPFKLDVTAQWPKEKYPGIFSANTTHIMSWTMVQDFFKGVSETLDTNGYFCLYGPFKFCGEHTSDGNQRFDSTLKNEDPVMGLRDFVDLEELAQKHNLSFVEKHDLPANNCLLVWQQPIRSLNIELD